MPATYDDANLVMQIVRWGTEMGLTEAVLSVLADDFDPETARPDDPAVLLAAGQLCVRAAQPGRSRTDHGHRLRVGWRSGIHESEEIA